MKPSDAENGWILQVKTLIDGISKAEWPGNSYSLLTRNCNHFSEDLATRLLVIA